MKMRPGLEIAHLGGDRPCAPCVEGGEEAGDASGMRATIMTYGVQQGREDILGPDNKRGWEQPRVTKETILKSSRLPTGRKRVGW